MRSPTRRIVQNPLLRHVKHTTKGRLVQEPIELAVGQVWRTASGDNARIVSVDRRHVSHPVVALVGVEENPWCMTINGYILDSTKQHEYDLAQLHRNPQRIEGYINIYNEGLVGEFFPDKYTADELSRKSRVACVKVTGLEEVRTYRRKRGTKGQVEEVTVEKTNTQKLMLESPIDSGTRAVPIVDAVRGKTKHLRESQ